MGLRLSEADGLAFDQTARQAARIHRAKEVERMVKDVGSAEALIAGLLERLYIEG